MFLGMYLHKLLFSAKIKMKKKHNRKNCDSINIIILAINVNTLTIVDMREQPITQLAKPARFIAMRCYTDCNRNYTTLT